MTSTQPEAKITRTYGPSGVVFEPPNLLRVQVGEPLRHADVVGILDCFSEFSQSHGRLRTLIDVSRLGKIGREHREIPASRRDVDATLAMAITGASFGMRVTITMLLKAMRILRTAAYPYPFEFFDSSEAALEWLMRQNGGEHPPARSTVPNR